MDSFKNYINKDVNKNITEYVKITEKTETISDAENILRENGYKIKLIIPTKFGIQIDFAKSFNIEDIKNLLPDYKLKFDGKSIFIIKE